MVGGLFWLANRIRTELSDFSGTPASLPVEEQKLYPKAATLASSDNLPSPDQVQQRQHELWEVGAVQDWLLEMVGTNSLWDYRILIKNYTLQRFPVTLAETLADQATTTNTSTNPPRGLMPLLLLCGLMMCGLSARASTLTVTNLGDSGPGTLRDQIAAAASGDTINFSVTGSITLAGGIGIGKNLTIAGPGASSLTLSMGQGGSSVFNIGSGIVGISGLTLSDASGFVSGGAISMTGGTVTMTGCTLTNNILYYTGGAIYQTGGSLAVINSIICNNGVTQGGGGIYITGGSLAVTDSTISGNIVYNGYAGGIFSGGSSTVTITGSTISGNHAQNPNDAANNYGGGIFNNGGGMTITNSTISGNSCDSGTISGNYDVGGGGIANFTTLTLANSTITTNFGQNGGGIENGGTVNLFNSIIAGNQAVNDGYDLKNNGGSVPSGDYNLVQSIFGSPLHGTHNITGQPALLAPLANNGGLTKTHKPLAGSPALDAGDPNFDTTNTPYDQRGPGFPRVKNSRLCIGAFESELSQSGSSFIVNSLDDHDDGIAGPTDCSLREAVRFAPAGAIITFSVTGTIILTGGEMMMTNNLTIAGPTNAPGITISGNNLSRIFAIRSTVALSNLTLSRGNGVGATFSGNGGAISVDTTFTLAVANCTFSSNSVTGNSGAIRGAGTLSVMNSTFSGNHAASPSASGGGGAIAILGTLTVRNSTFFGNSAAVNAGAIYVVSPNGTLSLSNSIVAGNSAANGPDIFGTVASGDYNLVQNTAGATLAGTHNITGQPALLGPLANNGGPTKTHALLAGSPAIDRGDTTLTEDQRGVSRPQGTADDIGAFEWQPHHPTLSIGLLSVSQVQICWDTVTNTWYQLQYRSTLTMNQWSPLTAWIGGSDQTICTNDSIVLNGPQRFYRVGVTNAP